MMESMQRVRSVGVLVLLSLLLSGCAKGGPACREQYWDGIVGTCLPAGWKATDPVLLRGRGVPEEVTAVFQADQMAAGQIPTVIVTKELLLRDFDARSYGDASVQSVKTLPGYTLLDERVVKVDGEKVPLHIFTAQPIAEEPAKRFYQVSTVFRKVGYTFTGTLPVTVEEDLEEQVLLVLKGARFRAEEE